MSIDTLSAPVKMTQRAVAPLPTVCQVVHCLSVGGAELLAAQMARSLRHRFRFVFACLDELGPLGQSLSGEGFPVHVLNRRPGIDLACARRLAGVLRDEQVDLVHAHQHTPYFQSAMARGLFGKTPVLFTEHGRHHPDSRSSRRVLANRILTRRQDRIVGVGRAVREALIQFEGFSRRKVEVVYNGINLDPFREFWESDDASALASPDAASHSGCFRRPNAVRAAVRRELGIDDSPVVMQVARLNQLKDHETAFRSIQLVVAQIPGVRLLLIGDGEERERLIDIVQRKSLGDVVMFLGTRRDIPRLLTAADVFLLSSVSEGIPLTLIEAMAAGVPVVSTRVGGIGEMIEHEKTGFLAAAGDDAALARHVVELLRSPELHSRVAETAHRRAFECFSQERMNAEYSRIYEEMLHG